MDAATRKILIALGIVLIVTLALSSTMGGMMGPGVMGPSVTGGWSGWMWGAGMWLGGVVMVVFWGALIVGAVLVVRLLGGLPGGHERDTAAAPLDILKQRYARGDVTREQYEQMRRDLEL